MTTPLFALQAPLRILVMRYRFIGDTILTVPFLRNLRRAYPHAQIEALVEPVSGDALAACPYLDALLPLPAGQSLRQTAQFLRDRRYDVAFVLKRSMSSAVMAWWAGIPARIGFDAECRRLLLTRAVPYRRDRPESDCFLDVLRAAGAPVTDRGLEAFCDEAAHRVVAPLVCEAQPRALIHLTSSNPRKEVPLDLWIALTRWLIETGGYHLYASGSAQDAPRYASLVEALSPSARDCFHNLCGQTTVGQTIALIQRMEGVLGVDSGALHLGAACQKPVIGLYTAMTNLEKWAPLVEPRALIRIQEGSASLEEIQQACRQCWPNLR